MKRTTILLVLSVLFFTLHRPVIAQESALSSAPHSDEWKIQNALIAGPDFVTARRLTQES
jgi:hypothetical protein